MKIEILFDFRPLRWVFPLDVVLKPQVSGPRTGSPPATFPRTKPWRGPAAEAALHETRLSHFSPPSFEERERLGTPFPKPVLLVAYLNDH